MTWRSEGCYLGCGEIQTRKWQEGTFWDARNVVYLYLSSDHMDSAHVNSHQAVQRLMHSMQLSIFVIPRFFFFKSNVKCKFLCPTTRDSFPEKSGIQKIDSSGKIKLTFWETLGRGHITPFQDYWAIAVNWTPRPTSKSGSFILLLLKPRVGWNHRLSALFMISYTLFSTAFYIYF